MSLFSNFIILFSTARFCDKIICINSVECCSVSVKVPEPAQQGTVWFGSHQRLATCSYSRSTKSRRRNRPKRDTSTKPVDKLQTNKGRKVVREFYDSDTEKAYVDGLVLIYSVSFNPACPQFYSTHFASLDTPGPLLHRSALTSTFIDIWNSIDRSSSLLPLLRLLPDFHLHRHRHYYCSMNPYHLAASSTLSFPLPLAVQSIYHGISIHHICYQRSRNTSHRYASKPSL